MDRADVWILGAAVLGCALIVVSPAPAQNEPAQQAGVEFAGLKSPVPKDWHEDRPLQKETYKRYQLDAIGDIKYNAHVTLARLEKNDGNSVANVVKTWQSQFSPPEGKTIADVTRVDKKKVGTLEFSIVEITGTFMGYADEPGIAYPDFRLVGVYAQGPDGIYTARLLGPSETVEFYRPGFAGWIKGLK